MSKERFIADKLPSTKVILEVGGAGVGLAAAGAAGYVLYRRRRHEANLALDPLQAPEYEKRLQVFTEPKLSEEKRLLLASVATRVFLATVTSSDQVITRRELLARQPDTTTAEINHVLGHLKDNELIGRRSAISDPRTRGYYALPALEWGMSYGKVEPLIDAQQAIVGEM